jgi:hypothetical protein
VIPSSKHYKETSNRLIRSSAISRFLGICYLGADLHYEDDISFLLTSSFNAAKNNPLHINRVDFQAALFVQYAHMNLPVEYMGLVTTCLQNEEWTLSSDCGYCLTSAAILFQLHPHIPHQGEQFERWMPLQSVPLERDMLYQYWRRRNEVIEKMLRNITENFRKEAFEDGSKYPADAINILLEVTRVSLVYASPLKGLHASQHNPRAVRRLVVQEVLSLLSCARKLQMDIVFVQFDEEDPFDILAWVQEWEVLDLWIDCLRRSGINVPRRTRRAWMRERENYRHTDLLEEN